MKRRDFLAATSMTSIMGIPVKAIDGIRDEYPKLEEMPKEVDYCIAAYARSQRMAKFMTTMARKLEDRGWRSGSNRLNKYTIELATDELKYPDCVEIHEGNKDYNSIENTADPRSHYHRIPFSSRKSESLYNGDAKGIFHMDLFQIMEMLCEWRAEHEDCVEFTDFSGVIREKCKELELDDTVHSWLLRTAWNLGWAN